MNMQDRLDQFREDNPYDFETQAKRLLAGGDKELILYTLQLGLQTAKQRQRHFEREVMKSTGDPPTPIIKLKPGPTTGSVVKIERKPSKRIQNIAKRLVMDVWIVDGDVTLRNANEDHLRGAIKKDTASCRGLQKNIKFHGVFLKNVEGKKGAYGKLQVGETHDDKYVKDAIVSVYGKFREQKIA